MVSWFRRRTTLKMILILLAGFMAQNCKLPEAKVVEAHLDSAIGFVQKDALGPAENALQKAQQGLEEIKQADLAAKVGSVKVLVDSSLNMERIIERVDELNPLDDDFFASLRTDLNDFMFWLKEAKKMAKNVKDVDDLKKKVVKLVRKKLDKLHQRLYKKMLLKEAEYVKKNSAHVEEQLEEQINTLISIHITLQKMDEMHNDIREDLREYLDQELRSYVLKNKVNLPHADKILSDISHAQKIIR